jgi:O-6-methylguanine DNA methyltransferase
MIPAFSLAIPTADGTFTAHFSERGLVALDFPSAKGRPTPAPIPGSLPAKSQEWPNVLEKALGLALAGRKPGRLPPLDRTGATPFRLAVWEALREIPCGQTRSYAEIAAAIGRPKAARAVGQACGANPIPILVPCHRVLAAGSRLGGFAGGLPWKQRLLEREGAWPVAG